MTLTSRLFIVNFAGACLAAWAWWNGSIQQFAKADSSHFGLFILALFIAITASAFVRAREIDKAASQIDLKRARIRAEHIATAVAAMFMLGIIGNAKGLIAGFDGISAEALMTAEGGAKFAAQVLAGISTTFGATVIGTALALWTTANAQAINTRLSLRELDAI